MTHVRLRILGQVQGVSFRYYARQRALSLGLSGWVRNCPDGTVEVQAQGNEADVQAFIEWAHRGPSPARVERVEVERLAVDGSTGSFRILG